MDLEGRFVFVDFVEWKTTKGMWWHSFNINKMQFGIKFLKKIDLLKFKLQISEALVASPSANRSIIDKEDAIDLFCLPVKRSKYYKSTCEKTMP
ncbi:hypothetical protein NPIL_574781 [Nephila pilipes]|uniref:Uncharacterized protein n=1 Tax=Nephila pilipes TaxID=299642 RepID=A0A8X6PLC7_NEPPI|nr:hypothetical protein NPIL_574781 [Nephila pilipes]